MITPTELSEAEIAILSLLSEGEQHGYALNETIKIRGFRNWTNIGFSSIYWILNRLEKAKLISSRKDPSTKGPPRRLYRLNKAGRIILFHSIRQSLSKPEPPRSRVDLGAAYIELLSLDERIQCLEKYRSRLQNRIRQISKVRQEQEPLPFGAKIIFDHGTIKGKAELEWVEGVLRQLRASQENQHCE